MKATMSLGSLVVLLLAAPASSAPPANAATCTITGRAIGNMSARRCEDINCPDRSPYARYALREIWLKTGAHGQRVRIASLRMRRIDNGRGSEREWWYLFAGVPAGTTYTVGLPPPWRQDPNPAPVTCVGGQSHRRDLQVTGLTGWEF